MQFLKLDPISIDICGDIIFECLKLSENHRYILSLWILAIHVPLNIPLENDFNRFVGDFDRFTQKSIEHLIKKIQHNE